jgi:hypothetical protein
MLALPLHAVVSQRLVKRADGKGRDAAVEVMINSPNIRDLIAEGKTTSIEKAIARRATSTRCRPSTSRFQADAGRHDRMGRGAGLLDEPERPEADAEGHRRGGDFRAQTADVKIGTAMPRPASPLRRPHRRAAPKLPTRPKF